MKRFFALLLVVALILCVAGCNTKVESSNTNSLSEETSSLTEETSSSEPVAEKNLCRGTLKDGVYENEFIGIGIEFGEGWEYFPQASLNQLSGLSEDYYDDNFENYFNSTNFVFDVYAARSELALSITLNIEKLNALTKVLADDLGSYLESQMPSLKASLESQGYSNFSYELTDVVIGDKTFKGVAVVAEIYGNNLYQVLFAIPCNDDYIANAGVGCYAVDITSPLIDCFYILD